MSTRLRRWKLIRISCLNALIMLFVAYYWLSLPRTFGDEAFLIKWSSLIRKSLLGFDEKPAPKDVLFVDVSGSKTTVPDEEPDIQSFFSPGELETPYHRKVITDRKDLVAFFKILNKYQDDIQFVLCDILFEDSTAHDEALQKEIASLGNKILGVSHLQEGKNFIEPVISMPNASATYRSTSDLFLKFPLLIRDSIKTVPLVMYEKTKNARFSKSGPFYLINNQLSLPSPIVDFRIRYSEFRDGFLLSDTNYVKIPMATILESELFWDSTDMRKYFEDRIVLLGDFKTDVHNTSFGETPGLLILYNAYLTLVYRQHLISFWWILFLFISFFILTYRILADVKILNPSRLVKIFRSRMGKYILNSLDEMALLIFITLMSYLLFNIHINILILFIYLKVMEWVWKKFFVPSLQVKIEKTAD